MTGLNAKKNRTVLLIEKIVYNANLGVIAALIGIVHGKCWAWIANSHPGIPAMAANIGILALRGCRGSMGCIVDIRRGRRSAKGPSRVAGWFVQGLAEEPERRVPVCEIDPTGVEKRCHLIVGYLRDSGDRDSQAGQDSETRPRLEPHRVQRRT